MKKIDRPTSFDIAYRAGVSQSTVSRALRNSPLVSPETRDKIQAIARELNYKVDKHAASLRSQSSNTIALLLFEDPTSDASLINPFFLSMLGNITRSAALAGFDLLVSFQRMEEDWVREYEFTSRADGMILLGYGDYRNYVGKLEQLLAAGAHFVIWGPMIKELEGHSLGCDNIKGSYEATRHLVSLGHKDIAFVGDASTRFPEFRLRYKGHKKALTEANLTPNPDLLEDAESKETDGYQAVKILLEKRVPFTAIVAASDLIAIGCIQALRDSDKRIPEDVAVVGFDDIPAALYMNPPLTTVRQDTCEAGEMLVEAVLKSIRGEPFQSKLISPTLIVRESCGAKSTSQPG